MQFDLKIIKDKTVRYTTCLGTEVSQPGKRYELRKARSRHSDEKSKALAQDPTIFRSDLTRDFKGSVKYVAETLHRKHHTVATLFSLTFFRVVKN